ncbi:PREDICTED: coatomer subunit delta [Wasmannia auropunctata]|uniref:coatomer subunit delta n=1 Tax=Wasmannia auropunctata TaxID=64793 RepID=UPI0005F01F6D|nr:PREDICTED: coatomer subunit delta [Wasmannia auropunctata]
MVLIAAAVCTKAGKTIISRQFVEMTKARIEGLLAAFPKLMSSGKQHTFVETESVRYVYQPLEKVYMLLITTKASNILEDLETLRLFARVIPEYCSSMDELEITENAFNLIFAFDEIVALGYRENVNLAQIRTFVEMDSHEEKVYQAVRKTQEREAKNKMREKAKELQRQRMMEANKKGGVKSPGFGGGYGSGSTPVTPAVGDTANFVPEPIRPSYKPKQKPVNAGPGAMKLGGKSRDVDSFVDQLKEEGENVVSGPLAAPGTKLPQISPQIINTELVHLRQEERLNVRVGRDGGLQNFELHGLVTLHISDEKWGRIRVQVENGDTRGIQLQTHPNVDKELFRAHGQIGLKVPTKPFPLNTDVGVLKWRFQAQDETALPISINCWPSENGEGGCDVNIEYELEQADLELNDVQINIPLPIGCNPIVSECDGQYTHEARRNTLVWSLPVIDASTKSGSMEFSAPSSTPADFFPLHVSFTSKMPYAKIKVSEVLLVEDESPVKYSVETVFFTDNYEVV